MGNQFFLSFKHYNMRIRIFTKFYLFIAGTLSLVVLKAQPAPFYQETFPNAAAFTSNWTQGGVNPGSEDWVWSNNPVGIFDGQSDFTSTTASNGFIQFNSDRNGDVMHDVFVTSKAINCSGKNTVFLRSENQYGFFSEGQVSITEVGISTNGTDFTYKRILANVERNDLSDAVQVVTIELPEAANQPSVYIRFRWRGRFEYAWRIDDIALFDANPTPANDLTVDLPRVPFNFATPLSQVDETLFNIRVENIGTAPQSDVTAKVEVAGDNGDSFMSTENIGTLAPLEDDTVAFAETFTPTNTGNYTLTYTVNQTEMDASPSNNKVEGEFVITESLFSKDDGIPSGANQPLEFVDEFWEIGNYYVITKEGYEAFEASFSIASNDDSQVGQTVNVFLYRLEDDGNSTFDDDDLRIVGFGSKELTTTDTSYTLITTELFPLEGELEPGIPLEPGDYFLMVQLAQDMFMVYSALGYYYDFSTVVKNGEWFLGGFGPEATAIVRMRIRESAPTGTKEPQLADYQVEIYPNPTYNNLNVNVSLLSVTQQAQLTVMDVTGKTILVRNYEGIKNQTISLDASKWAAGTYFLHLRTDEGVSTKRFVVQH